MTHLVINFRVSQFIPRRDFCQLGGLGHVVHFCVVMSDDDDDARRVVVALAIIFIVAQHLLFSCSICIYLICIEAYNGSLF
jgi:hypothetical protein